MNDIEKRDYSPGIDERKDEATSSRTLDEIEDEQEISENRSDLPLPSPDEGTDRTFDDNPGAPV